MEEGEEEQNRRLDSEMEILLTWASHLGISDSCSLSSSSCASPSSNPNPPHASGLGRTLSVAHFPEAGGRGLSAVRDISRGELVLKVPESALFTTRCLLHADPHLSAAVNDHPSLSPSQILTVCLLHEMAKGRHSRWYPYLNSLPRHYDTLATFSQFEMHALQVEDAIWAAKKAKCKSETDWKHALFLMEQLNFRANFLTFRAWLWASATISSRTLHVPWDEAGCLCPVGDLFNYAAPGEELEDVGNLPLENYPQINSLCYGDSCNPSNLEQFDTAFNRLTDGGYEEDFAAYCFYSKRNYKRGEQVLLSYGTYTNLELLEYYGFLLDQNLNDKVYIPLESGVYSFNRWPAELLYIHQNGRPSFALLCTLRLWATPPNQRKSVGHLAYTGALLSPENEMFIMGVIVDKCNVILENLQTSIEEDHHLLYGLDKVAEHHCPRELRDLLLNLGGDSLTFLDNSGLQKSLSHSQSSLPCNIRRSMDRWKLAVQWRLKYKETLIGCISYCTKAINILRSRIPALTFSPWLSTHSQENRTTHKN